MSVYIVPILFLVVIIIGFFKKVPLYDTFAEGAKEGLKLSVSIFPYLCAMFIVLELFNVSGLSQYLVKGLAPILNMVGIPPELGKLLIIRPLSGSGSIAVIKDLYVTYGADSYIARCASVIVGCSETIFYVTAVYFATSKIKKLRYCMPIAIFSSLVGAVVGCLVCRFL